MSRFLKTLQLGFKSLLLHKLRTGLAMLGILIGVTAVVWLVALGEGVSYQAQQQIKELGATNIINQERQTNSNVLSRRLLSRTVWFNTRRLCSNRLNDSNSRPSDADAREYGSRFDTGIGLVDVKLVGCTPEYL